MGHIDWVPIGDLLEHLKDGRELLLAVPDTLGTADGGDGVKLNPEHPYMLYVGRWHDGYECWVTTESEDGDNVYLNDLSSEPSHFAELNYPGE